LPEIPNCEVLAETNRISPCFGANGADYVRAGELKAAGMVWTEVLELEEENERARIAAEILASGAYATTGEEAHPDCTSGRQLFHLKSTG
jgi:hypothetical protein